MTPLRSGNGTTTKQPHFSLSEIERICSGELEKAQLLPAEPGPVRIERFIEKRFGISPSYSELPDTVLGFTEFGAKGVTAIVVSRALDEANQNKTQERRLRTTLAHEAGHGLLHSKLFALGERPSSLFEDGGPEPAILCRDVLGETKSQSKYDGRWWEFQANRAMASLLMPRKLVAAAATQFLTPTGLLGLPIIVDERRTAAIREVAELFDVNPVVAKYRLNEIYPQESDRHPTL